MPRAYHPNSKPDQQGKFDGLCGMYAIPNSIKWLYHIGEDDLDIQSLCESLPGKFPEAADQSSLLAKARDMFTEWPNKLRP